MIWCVSDFSISSACPLSSAERMFMAPSVRISSAVSIVPFPGPVNSSQMYVRKRNGSLEPADVNKIVRAVERCCEGLKSVDPRMFVTLQRRIICLVFFGFACFLMSPQLAAAQGSAQGTVTDPLGAIVPNAKVTLMLGSAAAGKTTTDAEGKFSFASVSSGRYHVQVEATGFAAFTGPDVYLGTGDVNFDATLRIGPLAQAAVVTATGSETPISQVGASITFIDSGQIEVQNKLDMLEDLPQVPGAQVVQTSQRGGATSLFIRGGESDFNKVLIDGIPINAIGGGFDYSQLLNAGIDSVEVLRGSNSVVYGADALAGVVSITTKQGTTPLPVFQYSADGGNFGTVNQDGSFGGVFQQFDYFTDYSGYQTNGSYPNNFFRNDTVSGSVGWHPNSTTQIRLTGLHTTTDLGEPNAILFYGISDDSTARNQNTYLGATVQNQTTPRWHNLVQFSFSQEALQNVNPTCTGTPPDQNGNCFGNTVTIRGANGTSGTGQAVLDSTFGGFDPFPQIFTSYEARHSAYVQSDYQFLKNWTGTFGFRYEHEDGSGITRNNYSYFLEGHGNIKRRLYITSGVGLDWNQVFHFAATPRVSAAYYLRVPTTDSFFTATKLTSNFGQGIKEESTFEQGSTLYDLLTPMQRTEFGVGPIGPERSRTYDGGIEQGLWHGRVRLNSIFYYSRYYNLIDFLSGPELISIGVPPEAAAIAVDTAGGAYVNATSTRAFGFENTLLVDIGHGFMFTANYTYLDAVVTKAFGEPATNPNYPGIPIGAFSPLQGQRPFRRAPNTESLMLTYNNRKFSGAFTGYIVSKRDDSTLLEDEDENLGNTLLLPNRNLAPAYQIFDLSGRYHLTSYMALYTSIENLFSQHYQAAFGFPGLPFTIRSGITFTIGGKGWAKL
jgi:vitamin B12 transporter